MATPPRGARPLTGLTKKNFVREAVAGVTLLAIAVPLNIGYAQIAGLPPTAGLYALVLPAVVYALVVSSRQVVASPDAAAAALVASSVGGLAVAGSADYLTLALAQAILCGALFALMAFFKLGFLATFLSKPILIGFVGGLALDILVSQIAKMLGVTIDSGGEFVEKLTDLVAGLGTISGWSVAIAVAALTVLLIGRRLARSVPWALIVLILATVLVVTADLDSAGVDVLGKVEAGPPTLTWPVLDWTTWLALIPSAIALTMVTTAEGLLLSRAYGEQHGYSTKPNRDLLAFGLGNIASGATGGFTIGSSTSRTAAMDQLGSRTQLPSLITAVGTLLLLVFGTALLEEIPSPAIGAIVAVAVVPLLGLKAFARLWRVEKFEFAIGAVCFLVTLFVGAIPGIVVSFVLALINIVRRASRPAIDILAADDDPLESLLSQASIGTFSAPGMLVVRMAAPLFFANGAVFNDAVKKAVVAVPGGAGAVKHLVVDLVAVTDVDVTGADSFAALKAWLRTNQVELSFSRVRPDARARFERLGLITTEQVFATNRAAVAVLSG